MTEARFEVPPAGTHSPQTWAIARDLILSVTQEGAIDDKLWTRFCNDAMGPGIRCHFGIALGSPSISSVQRRAIVDALKNKQVTAIITSSIARGVVTAVGWLGLNVKGYSWKELDVALEKCGSALPPAEIKQHLETLLKRSGAPSISQLVK